jgi:hypothetical protein
MHFNKKQTFFMWFFGVPLAFCLISGFKIHGGAIYRIDLQVTHIVADVIGFGILIALSLITFRDKEK